MGDRLHDSASEAPESEGAQLEPEVIYRPVACFLEALESHLQRIPPGQEQVQVVVTGIELNQVEIVLRQKYQDRPDSKWILTVAGDHFSNGVYSGILVILRRNSGGRNTSVAD